MDILTIAGFAFGLAGAAGGFVGYFSKAKGDSIIAYQAREIELRDGSIARLEKTEATLTAKCDSQAEQIETLKSLAQGSPQLVKLTAAVEKNTSVLSKWVQNGGGSKS